jgi:uncharacterized membrane-anchored protein
LKDPQSSTAGCSPRCWQASRACRRPRRLTTCLSERSALDGLITLIIVLVVVGLCLYLVETYIPMSPPIKTVLRVVVVLVLVLWLLQTFVGDLPLPRLR